MRYLLNPVELLGKELIKGIKVEKMRLEGPAGSQKSVSLEPKRYSHVDCDMLIKSIGYKSMPIQGVPFDNKSSTITHHQGCVLT